MKQQAVFFVISVAMAAALGAAFSSSGEGQSRGGGSSDGAALRDGPGGMWVLHGSKLYVCTSGMIAYGNTPPAPNCGPATRLPD